MRSNLLRVFSALALLLLLLLSSAQSSSATGRGNFAQQKCTHPMRVGPWQGSFLTQLHFTDKDETIDAWLTEDGGVDFQVACDGTVTADRFVNSPDVIQDEPHVETVLEISNVLLGSATCTLESDWKVENARMELNESGSPRLVWAVKVIVISSKCEGEGPALEIAQSIWEDTTGGQSEIRTFTWQDETPEIITGFMGGEKPWQGPLANTSMEGLKKRFVVKKDLTTWSASFKGNVAPAPTATTEKGGPVVTGVTQQLEQFFLEKVTPVLNVYTASVDWGNEEPGQVTFQLGDVTTVGDLSGSSATAPIQIDNLPAGDNKLVVIATSAGGKSSVPFERIINVVPVPAWAVPAEFSATTKEGFVLYESTKVRPVPAQPANLQITVPSFVPYVGGDWGLLPTQFQVNMAASSAGGLSNATVTGGGGVAVAGNVFPLTVRTDSFFRTNMTEAGLGFDDGSVKMELPEKTFARKLGLLEVIPGATQILDTPVIGKALKLLDLSVFTAQLRTSLSGEGKLGVDGADLRFVDGSATSRVGMAIAAGPNISDVAFLQLIGTVDGALTLGLTPDIHPTACSISGSIFAWYGAFGFTGTYPNPPSAIQILSCDQFKQGGTAKVLAMPPAAPEPLRLPQRTASWKPELVLDPPKQVSSENGLTSNMLVENVSALTSAPRIATGPGGRMAVAWIADVPERERPQSFQVRLRLFDGKSWGPAVTLSNDTRPDYFPSVAFDRDGKTVVAWVQSSNDDLKPDVALTTDLLQSMEIAYAVVGTDGGIVKSGTLTNDSALDMAPQLSAGREGTVWLAWQSNASGSLSGSKEQSSSVQVARWDGQTWSALEQAYGEVTGPIDWDLAGYDNQKATILAATRSGDDTKVATIEHGASGWSAPSTVSGDEAHPTKPQIVYKADGSRVAAWSSDSGVQGIVGDLKAAASTWFTEAHSLEALAVDAGDSLGLVLSSLVADGRPGLMLSRYDDSRASWGAPQGLMEHGASSSQLSAVLGGNNEAAVLLAEPIARTEKRTLDNGQALEVAGVPELANIRLIRAKIAVEQASPTATVPGQASGGTGSQAHGDDMTLWLVGGGAAAVLVVLGAVLLSRRRK